MRNAPRSSPSPSKSPFCDTLPEASADIPKVLPLARALFAPDTLRRETVGPSPASLHGGMNCRRQLVLTDDTASDAASLLALDAHPSRDSLHAASIICYGVCWYAYGVPPPHTIRHPVTLLISSFIFLFAGVNQTLNTEVALLLVLGENLSRGSLHVASTICFGVCQYGVPLSHTHTHTHAHMI